MSFQLEVDHRRPVWPSGAEDQQMQVHLDIKVDDLAEASRHAIESGATLASYQGDPDDVWVHLDPDGHPFCLFLR